MLLSAANAARRTETQVRMAQLARVADWGRLTDFLRAGRLLPTLGPRILEIGPGPAGGGFETALSGAREECRRQDALLQLIGERVMDSLAETGIRSTALKGPLLGERLYGEAARRLSSDIDLLVAPNRLADAVAVVRELGYGSPDDPVGSDNLPLLHFSLAHERDELPPVELHWRIHWYESRFASERLLAPSPASPNDWHPAPADELATLLLLYARDGFTGLRQATDIAAWWDRFGADLPPGAIEELARAYPELRPALAAAAALAGRWVGLPTGMVGAGRPGRRGRVAIRLSDPRPYASREQLFAEIGLVDGLLTPPGGLRAFFRRQLVPPRDVIRQHARKARSGGVTSTMGYGFRMLCRYGLATARLAGLPGAQRLRFGPGAEP